MSLRALINSREVIQRCSRWPAPCDVSTSPSVRNLESVGVIDDCWLKAVDGRMIGNFCA